MLLGSVAVGLVVIVMAGDGLSGAPREGDAATSGTRARPILCIGFVAEPDVFEQHRRLRALTGVLTSRLDGRVVLHTYPTHEGIFLDLDEAKLDAGFLDAATARIAMERLGAVATVRPVAIDGEGKAGANRGTDAGAMSGDRPEAPEANDTPHAPRRGTPGEPAPVDVLVVHPEVDPALTLRLTQTLLQMDRDSAGQEALASLGLRRFVLCGVEDCESVGPVARTRDCHRPRAPAHERLAR